MKSEQCGKQTALGVTITGSMSQHIGGFARHRIQCVVDAMLDRITDKMKTAFDQIMLITRPISQILGFASDQMMVKIDEFAGYKILLHESFAEKLLATRS